MPLVSSKIIGRLSLYRRLLTELEEEGKTSIFSHELSTLTQVSSAQVRRDLMEIGYSGTPAKGYNLSSLLGAIQDFLDEGQEENVALIGVGNLGRAILAYFVGRRPHMTIKAAFDGDPEKTNRVIHGCKCYPLEELEKVIQQDKIHIAILAIPAQEAQKTANRLVSLGITGILNFAPVRLHVPPTVFVENNDITTSLEIVAYYSRNQTRAKKIG